LITNDTSFQTYYRLVRDIIESHYNDGYTIYVVDAYQVLVWDVDHLENRHIKITGAGYDVKNKLYLKKPLNNRQYHTNAIKPLKKSQSNCLNSNFFNYGYRNCIFLY
jgi:hypothetical protein